ncbi:alanine racemase, catabolic [Escherichia coli]|uniref:Alanine racemase, catabolic n=1 Tax=Escherichia coli TaxID=562 RepID=A0A376RJQ0_ECOLX|nr:alanine racemase, catabolic [Escherichia coli]
MTRPIQASLGLQALKQNLSIVRQAAPHAARLVGGKSERLRAWY